MTLKIIVATLLLATAALSDTGSSMIVYSAGPNAYFDDHAADIKKFADGFFFVAGDWSDASKRLAPANNPWREALHKNIASLRKAGVSENFLGVSFGEEAAWPSEQTLLGEAGLVKMRTDFAVVGRTAKSLGFRAKCPGLGLETVPILLGALEARRKRGHAAEQLGRLPLERLAIRAESRGGPRRRQREGLGHRNPGHRHHGLDPVERDAGEREGVVSQQDDDPLGSAGR